MFLLFILHVRVVTSTTVLNKPCKQHPTAVVRPSTPISQTTEVRQIHMWNTAGKVGTNSEATFLNGFVGKRKISYFGLVRNLIWQLISPNQDDLSYSSQTFISGNQIGWAAKHIFFGWSAPTSADVPLAVLQ